MNAATETRHEIENGDLLPPALRALVELVIAEIGVGRIVDPAAMRGECQVIADRIVAAASEVGTITDEDGDEWSVEAWPVQLFDPPAELADDPMAHGHYVARVVWGLDGEYYIDLTAAQFSPRHSGPVVRTWHGW